MDEKKDVRSRRKAAALRYRPDADAAPRVTAAGRGLTAEKIIALAKEAGIPLREDASLVEVLARLDVGSEIPAELYRAVAELLAFVYRMDQRWREKHAGKGDK